MSGSWFESARQPVQAIKHYEAFLSASPKDERACDVRLRISRIYRRFSRCDEVRRHLESAARDFPDNKSCARSAQLALMSCPDFFPLDQGRTWIYVDSDSQGRAMRLNWQIIQSTGSEGGTIQTALYAGERQIRQAVENYEKKDWSVWRLSEGGSEPILRYPYTEGRSWRGKRGASNVEWTVVSTGTKVHTFAGDFEDCLKAREHDLQFKNTWRYDYYCPSIGRVKTTVGGPGYENPNTELLRFGKIN
jgi:hypothetical protein